MSQSGDAGDNYSADQSVDELNQSKRLEEIHAAKERFVEKKRQTEAGLALNKIKDEYAAKSILRSALEDYIAEVGPLMKSREEYEDYWTGDEDDPLGEFELPDGEEVTIQGLRDIIQEPNPYITKTKEVPPPPPGRPRWPTHQLPDVTEKNREVHQIPRDILISAYWTVNEFLNEIGLDIKLSESLHETVITEEMLDDVAEWMDRRGVVYKPEQDDMNYQ